MVRYIVGRLLVVLGFGAVVFGFWLTDRQDK